VKERILVCGGREYHDRQYFFERMNYAKQWFAKEFCIIHGHARGADMLAHVWCFETGCATMSMPANWHYYDKRAGPIRNRWMLKWGMPDLVIAFPGNSGTADMVSIATNANIDVWKP